MRMGWASAQPLCFLFPLKNLENMNDLILSNLDVASIKSPAFYTKSEVLTDISSPRTLTAAEAGTVFLVDDAALILVLPNVSNSLVGAKFKFVVAEEETTGLTIKTQGNTHFMNGYAVITADAAVPQLFVPDGDSMSEVNLNGGTTGGKGAGISGDSGIINVIECTCISGSAGAAWFVEAHLFGDGTIATPFADQ